MHHPTSSMGPRGIGIATSNFHLLHKACLNSSTQQRAIAQLPSRCFAFLSTTSLSRDLFLNSASSLTCCKLSLAQVGRCLRLLLRYGKPTSFQYQDAAGLKVLPLKFIIFGCLNTCHSNLYTIMNITTLKSDFSLEIVFHIIKPHFSNIISKKQGFNTLTLSIKSKLHNQ